MGPLAILAGAGAAIGGIGNFLSGNRNAKRLEAQAAEERRATEAEIRRMKDEQRAVIGEQLAAQVSNGLEGGSGTALNALRQSQVNAALDVMIARRTGEFRARALNQQARDTRTEAKFGLLSSIVGGASNVYKQNNDWAQERRANG